MFRANIDKVRRAVQTRLAMEQSVKVIRSILVHWLVEHIKGTDLLWSTYLCVGEERWCGACGVAV